MESTQVQFSCPHCGKQLVATMAANADPVLIEKAEYVEDDRNPYLARESQRQAEASSQ